MYMSVGALSECFNRYGETLAENWQHRSFPGVAALDYVRVEKAN